MAPRTTSRWRWACSAEPRRRSRLLQPTAGREAEVGRHKIGAIGWKETPPRDLGQASEPESSKRRPTRLS